MSEKSKRTFIQIALVFDDGEFVNMKGLGSGYAHPNLVSIAPKLLKHIRSFFTKEEGVATIFQRDIKP